jgi:hypothetical protein
MWAHCVSCSALLLCDECKVVWNDAAAPYVMYDTAVHPIYSAMHLLWMRLHVHVRMNPSSCCSDMYRRDWMQYGCCMCVCLQMDMLATDSVYFVFCYLYVELCLCLGVCCIVFVVVSHVHFRVHLRVFMCVCVRCLQWGLLWRLYAYMTLCVLVCLFVGVNDIRICGTGNWYGCLRSGVVCCTLRHGVRCGQCVWLPIMMMTIMMMTMMVMLVCKCIWYVSTLRQLQCIVAVWWV